MQTKHANQQWIHQKGKIKKQQNQQQQQQQRTNNNKEQQTTTKQKLLTIQPQPTNGKQETQIHVRVRETIADQPQIQVTVASRGGSRSIGICPGRAGLTGGST